MKNIGSRLEVWNNEAKRTSGRLTKEDLFMDGETLKSIKASNIRKKKAEIKPVKILVEEYENQIKNSESD